MDIKSLFREDRYLPDRFAIVTYSEKLTYEEFYRMASSLSMENYSAVAVKADIGTELLILLYACLINDTALIMISPDYTTEQTEKILADTSPDIFLCAEKFKQNDSSLTVENFVRNGGSYVAAVSSSKKGKSLLPDETFLVLFTSGSSGKPKGVCISRNNILTDMYAIGRSYIHAPESIYLHIMPLYHIFGIISSMTVLWECGTLCIGGGISALMHDMKYFSPTALDIVPEAAAYILKRVCTGGTELLGGRLKTILCGGAQVRRDIVTGWAEKGVIVWGCYGMTECSACVCFSDSSCTAGTAGRPINCNQVRIGQDGMIYVSGSNIMLGYLNGDRSRFSGNWFCTGDLGYFNDSGELVITGRSDNLITTDSGENILFAKVESILKSNPCVIDVRMQHKYIEGIPKEQVIYVRVAEGADIQGFLQWKERMLGKQFSGLKFIVCGENEWMNDKIFGSEQFNGRKFQL